MGVTSFPPSWSRLKAFTQSHVFKIGGTILGAGTLGAAALEHLKQWDAKIGAPLTFKVSFLASLIGAGAIAVFNWLCPDSIKHSDNFESFHQSQRDLFNDANDDNKLDVILTHVVELTEPVKARIRALNDKWRTATWNRAERTEAEGLKARYFGTAVLYYLRDLWQTADRSKPALRVVLIVWLGLSWTLSILVFCYRAIQLLTS